MQDFKLKIGSSEFKISENTFNYIKDDTLMPKIKTTNADFENKTIKFEIIYNADPLRTLEFLKKLRTPNYRFFQRKKRIQKRKYKNITKLIKFN